MWILGISAYYHDSAAVIIKDGKIIAAAQEERFNRQKHSAAFPEQAIQFCLEQAGITLEEVDSIAFYEKPLLRFERLLETYLAFAPKGWRSFLHAMPLWLKEKLFQKRLLINELKKIAPDVDTNSRLRFCEHHLSHAASAFYPSPFERALVLVMDGVGEWATTSVMLGDGQTIQPLKEMHFPHSLGLLYSAFTSYCGFKVNDGEYKLMGLAPYGKPRYVELIKQHLITVADDGSFSLNMHYFNYTTDLQMTNQHFHTLFGQPPRRPDQPISSLEMDLAASIQQLCEEVILTLSQAIRKEYQVEHLCLAGGVALNCVVNGKLLSSKTFKNIWVQPAAGDAGGAIGCALATYHLHHQQVRSLKSTNDAMQGGYLGPAYGDEEILKALQSTANINFERLNDQPLLLSAATALNSGKVIAWFQGRMEFGPRALGARSILGDPRQAKMQSLINQKIKFRESFRPFAPAVLRDDVSDYFELYEDSPYMLFVAQVQEKQRQTPEAHEQAAQGFEQLTLSRSTIPAVTHVDFSARIQTVTQKNNPRFYALIKQFKQLSGCGLVVNTSFNVKDEPIVCTPLDALNCFQKTALDELFIGNYRVLKSEHP